MKKVKFSTFILIALFTFVAFVFGWFFTRLMENEAPLVISTISKTPIPTPLSKYTIENLKATEIKPGKIEIKEELSSNDDFTSRLFSFEFNPAFDETQKFSTGQINLPIKQGKYPIIVMLRGYVDQERYETGTGTKNGASYFATNDFITIAPDFLGYAGSSEEAGNIFESRFQTYTLVLSLLKSLNQINAWDQKNIFLWGHSNGGQIALTVLEVAGSNYPTTLWAPVSKPFPYSILYYTDESDDRGKLIRRELAKFEDVYNTDLYSLTQYLDLIEAPVQIHQGTADDAVPYDWSDSLVGQLESKEKKVNYFKYPGADHNLKPNWNEVVEKDLDFFNNNIIN